MKITPLAVGTQISGNVCAKIGHKIQSLEIRDGACTMETKLACIQCGATLEEIRAEEKPNA